MIVSRASAIALLGYYALTAIAGLFAAAFLATGALASPLLSSADLSRFLFSQLLFISLPATPLLLTAALYTTSHRVVLDSDGVAVYLALGARRFRERRARWSDIEHLDVAANRSEIVRVTLEPGEGKPFELGLWDTRLREAVLKAAAHVPPERWSTRVAATVNTLTASAA